VGLDVSLQLGAFVDGLRLLLLFGLFKGARTAAALAQLQRKQILFVLLNNELQLLNEK